MMEHANKPVTDPQRPPSAGDGSTTLMTPLTLVDNAPGAAAQRALLRSIGDSSGAAAHRQLSTGIGASPRMVAQRQMLGHAFGSVVQRDIGDGGEALVGRQVTRLADGAVGTITDIPPGMHEYSPDINVIYSVKFPGGEERISAQNNGYALVAVAPSGSAKPAVAPSSALNLPAAVAVEPAPKAAAAASPQEIQARSENATLEALQHRLGGPLAALQVEFGDPSIALKPITRKALLERLRVPSTSAALIGPLQLAQFEIEVTKLEAEYASAAKQSAAIRKARQEQRLQQQEVARLKQVAEEQATKLAAVQTEANRTRLGGKYGAFKARMNDVEIAHLVSLVGMADDGKLMNLLAYAGYTKLVALLAKTTITNVNTLLPLLGAGQEDVLLKLLDNISDGQIVDLQTLIEQTNADKTQLNLLLTRLNKDAHLAAELMALAGARNEASIIALLDQGRTVPQVRQLLNTTSGKGNAPDAATVSAGVPIAANAATLLNTAGVKGAAADTVLLLAHAKVNNVVADAEALLNKQGTATDALALLNHAPLSRADAVLLMNTAGIKNGGADAVRCLARPGATAAVLVQLLNQRTAAQLYSFMDPARGLQTFAEVQAGLQANADQTFWGGEAGGAPNFSGPAADLTDIIARAVHPAVVDRYAGSRQYGNNGGVDLYGVMNMLLPQNTTYREYDLALFEDEAKRGKRRMVVGNNGRRYYTSDHYKTFTRFL